MTKRTLFFIFAFLLAVSLTHAGDDRSIKDLAKALTQLSPDVDPAEAQAISYTAHTTARRLKKEYRVVLNPEFTVFLYNVGFRKRGWGGDLGPGHRGEIDKTRAQDARAALG